jgi:hypothetical protein
MEREEGTGTTQRKGRRVISDKGVGRRVISDKGVASCSLAYFFGPPTFPSSRSTPPRPPLPPFPPPPRPHGREPLPTAPPPPLPGPVRVHARLRVRERSQVPHGGEGEGLGDEHAARVRLGDLDPVQGAAVAGEVGRRKKGREGGRERTVVRTAS